MKPNVTNERSFSRSDRSGLTMHPRRRAGSRGKTLAPAHFLSVMLMAATILMFEGGFLDASQAFAAEPVSGVIAGRASVIDGDTLEIHGQRIRLHGVDAPEGAQTCRDGSGRDYRCGQRAALALSEKLGQRTVSCEQRDIDRYRRIVAVCRIAGEDVNGWLVSEGWAVAYRRYSGDYILAEEAAKSAKRGMWAGAFVPPEEYRHGTGAAPVTERPSKTEQPASCAIKGNISGRGERIYHVPSGAYYDRTRIDPSKGERMFCSEAEAQAAGWRPSKR